MKYRVIEQNKKDRVNEKQQETTALRKRNTEKLSYQGRARDVTFSHSNYLSNPLSFVKEGERMGPQGAHCFCDTFGGGGGGVLSPGRVEIVLRKQQEKTVSRQ